jgi:hypothetical protein
LYFISGNWPEYSALENIVEELSDPNQHRKYKKHDGVEEVTHDQVEGL